MELQVLETGTPGGPGVAELDQAAATFIAARPRLFGIAFRILGTASEAEDVMQEVWLRWHGADRAVVVNSSAFLATTTTRLAINVAQSARRRRETYVDHWLPEPADANDDPCTKAEQAEAVELAVQLLLANLTPNERAAFVLREVFDYPYQQISEILQLRMDNTRQIVSRTRSRLSAERRAPVDAADQRRFLRAFLAAAQAGNLGDLEELLAQDAAA